MFLYSSCVKRTCMRELFAPMSVQILQHLPLHAPQPSPQSAMNGLLKEIQESVRSCFCFELLWWMIVGLFGSVVGLLWGCENVWLSGGQFGWLPPCVSGRRHFFLWTLSCTGTWMWVALHDVTGTSLGCGVVGRVCVVQSRSVSLVFV